ncbi:MAG: flagellar biosynthesis protein FlhA [Myxococcales bacterium]|nr:flagellar biosynthesis protein FlhA [Myxococcales bacterium]
MGTWGASHRGEAASTRAARSRIADGALALLLLAIVGMMIVPLPTPLLDILIASNIALAILMLLVGMAVPNGLAFAAMPTVLLVTTLYRLALNVSSTRLILLQADAGEVIRSFGQFVVRGDYVVGAVIFLILTLIQYVVVARGAERVAEVGARFTLDAMPGKQMAIDADLRAGVLTPEGARERRQQLERESQFYGAMDGAMKFVKGDAIAGIVITLINVIAGVGIGLTSRDLDLGDSLSLYGLLAIGDGLVSQIPSLLISVSAGIVVTRVASEEAGASLGREIGRQLFGNARVLTLAAGFLALLAVIPGLPMVPFALLALACGAGGYALSRTRGERGDTLIAGESEGAGAAGSELSLTLGPALAREIAEGPLQRALERTRQRLLAELGLPLPPVRVSVDDDLPARGHVLRLSEVPFAPEGSPREVSEGEAGAAELAAELERLARLHAAELLGMQQTQLLLEGLSERAPALVQNTVPRPVPLDLLARVLGQLVAEGVSIRALSHILETVAREVPADSDPIRDAGALTERVRRRLGRQVTHSVTHEGMVHLHPLDPMIEDAVRESVQPGEPPQLALQPDLARDIVSAVRDVADSQPPGRRPVLVTQPDVRRFVRELLAPELPQVAVLAYSELAPDARIDRRGPVRVGG